MELLFTKNGKNFTSEFVADGNFNLHIERKEKGFLFVQQRTCSVGDFASVRFGDFSPSDKVIEVDFDGIVYPKTIRIVSEIEPQLAIVTFAQ